MGVTGTTDITEFDPPLPGERQRRGNEEKRKNMSEKK